MFARIRETPRRLQVSLVEARRVGGRVRQTHVAALGSIGISPLPIDRMVFWTKLHQRLAALDNRIDSKSHAAILTAIHARIPMPTTNKQEAVRLDNARADVRFWETLRDANADDVQAHKAFSENLARKISEREAAAGKAAAKAEKAKERLARAERGED